MALVQRRQAYEADRPSSTKPSIISPVNDCLPYIDAEPTPSLRTMAQSVITTELNTLSADELSQPHPLLPPSHSENYTPLALSEFSRLEAKQPLNAIDTSRYESLSPPEPEPAPPSSKKAKTSKKSSGKKDKEVDAQTAAWRETLAAAYTSLTYLSNRRSNLEALDANGAGKEAWLAGNEVLVGELGELERELARRKEEIDRVVVERRDRQEGVRAEMEGMERTWKRGVGRVLEVEVAGEEIRERMDDVRRGKAV